MGNNSSPLGWTSLEDSERLVEAGLSVETADMTYVCCDREVIDIPECVYPDERYGDVPCWSLGALLKVLPKWVGWKKRIIDGTQVLYVNEEAWVYSGETFYEVEEDTLMASVIEAVLWCIENSYIKRSKKE